MFTKKTVMTMKINEQICKDYRKLCNEIPFIIEAKGVKQNWLAGKMKMTIPTFYRRLQYKDWRVDELEKMVKILNNG